MGQQASVGDQLAKLCDTESLAVLCTHGPGGSYGSLVAFAATKDIKEIIFATSRGTRKYANIVAEGQVALLIDNRCKGAKEFNAITAATAVGKVREIAKTSEETHLKLYLQKHPNLAEFIAGADCALLAVTVEKYVVVNHFQEATDFDPGGAD
ncbi:MAG: pyridoxamine 5'-phosphate oxidase family protein [Sedimentisphaerales bacterium]|nr:pyridoxamine 5'-phosphate oxidase family protein [Sedimentisphaerales bacterium]